MVFSSYKFIFVFLPLVFFGYFFLNFLKLHRTSKYFLSVSSLVFYYLGSPDFLPYFVISIIMNFLIGAGLNQLKTVVAKTLFRKLFLLFGIMVNVIFLGYFKYLDFLIENLNSVLNTDYQLMHIVLPIGISFFTFQLIAYLIDSYRGETSGYEFVDYLLFITFFPQLIVGPIVHHKDVVPQYNSVRNYKLNFDNIAQGLFLFSLGCIKKVALADNLTPFAQRAFDNVQGLTMPHAWLASISYTLSYYFDLSGYADMAIGLGCFFNIDIPINFNSPYKARDFADYWRRWHITLSKFLGDYIFRSIYKKGQSSRRFYLGIFITFLVSGFWHGAGWTFVAWGLLNGVLVIIAHMLRRADRLPPVYVGWPVTFLGVIVARVLFVSSSFSDAYHVIRKMVDLSEIGLVMHTVSSFSKQSFLVVLCLVITFFLPNSNELRERFRPNLYSLVVASAALVFSLLFMNRVADFLYFQF